MIIQNVEMLLLIIQSHTEHYISKRRTNSMHAIIRAALCNQLILSDVFYCIVFHFHRIRLLLLSSAIFTLLLSRAPNRIVNCDVD